MNEQIRESMSALLDDEADELDLQRVLRGLEQDGETAATWRRYHLAAAAVRRDVDDFADIDLSARIRAELDQEDDSSQVVAPRRGIAARFKPFASVAVAASVTAVILTSTQLYNSVAGNDAATSPGLAVSGNVSPVLGSSQAVGFGNANRSAAGPMSVMPQDQALANEMAQQRLEAYLRNHAEHASLNTSSGLMPFARAAGGQGH